MKGITPVIAIVLLLMVTIAIVGFSFTFLSDMFQTSSEAAGQQMKQQLGAMSSCIQIESISFDSVYVRNCGSGPLADFSVYVDNEKIELTNAPVVAENRVGELTLEKGVSGISIKVSSSSAQSKLILGHCEVNKIFPENLVGYWTLDGNADDVSGNGNDGTLVGNPNCNADGKFGEACEFDGIDDYIKIADTPSIKEFTSMTMSAWIKPQGTKFIYNIINKENYATKTGYRLIYYSNIKQLSCAVNDGTNWNYLTKNFNTDNAWSHAVCVWDGANLLMYGNGIYLGSRTGPTTMAVNTLPLRISQQGSELFNGLIDEVAIWNRAFTEDDVKKLYTSIC